MNWKHTAEDIGGLSLVVALIVMIYGSAFAWFALLPTIGLLWIFGWIN